MGVWTLTGRQLAGSALLAGSAVLAAGCSETVTGTPVANPTTNSTSTSATAAPSHSPAPSARPTPSTPAPPAPAGAIPLPADANGYVFIETKGEDARCQINQDSIGCEAAFTNSPLQDGEHANGVSMTAGGKLDWVLGNLGNIPTVPIDYKTYDAQGWTIVSSAEGTRFTNRGTGHGIFVSITKVTTF